MKKIFLFVMLAVVAVVVNAQPAKRRVTPAKDKTTQKSQETSATDRATLMFPTKVAMPEDVVWKRDIYRTLDLTQDKNAPLYYPVEPVGRQVNLFTYLFRLMLTGRINTYTYKLDGNESFDAKDKQDVKDVLDRYSIYYVEQNGKYTVENNDIPSAEVTRYYLKESVYLDQHTGTFSTKVVALCPVLMRGADDFGGEATPYPLFWVKYDDIASWLAKLPVMSSNLNNTTNMTADDYFTMNRYEGKIYKTANMQGRALANYCKTDSDMVKEQKKIEKQIVDFEDRVWGHLSHEDSVKKARQDSITLAQKTVKKSSARKATATAADGGKPVVTQSRTRNTGSAATTEGQPRASARRQRR